MRPAYYTLTTVSNSNPYVLNVHADPFNVSLGCTVTGTVTYTVQYTFDDVQQSTWTPASGNWTNHTNLTAQTTTKDSNIAYPVTAVRLQYTAGTGSVTMAVIQAGI